MKEELNDLQPLLKQKTREVQGLLVTLEKDQKGAPMSQFISVFHAVSTTFPDANAMRVICARDTDAAAVKQRACQEVRRCHNLSVSFTLVQLCFQLKATCKADLDTALPALNSAVEALKSLSKVRRVCVVFVCVYLRVLILAFFFLREISAKTKRGKARQRA
jgi:hypothetical protein